MDAAHCATMLLDSHLIPHPLLLLSPRRCGPCLLLAKELEKARQGRFWLLLLPPHLLSLCPCRRGCCPAKSGFCLPFLRPHCLPHSWPLHVALALPRFAGARAAEPSSTQHDCRRNVPTHGCPPAGG